MCLYLDKKRTADWKRRKKGTFEVYKVLQCFNKELMAPYQYTTYKPGYIKSNRLNKKLTERELSTHNIYEGIHVCIDLDTAQSIQNLRKNTHPNKNYVIVKLKVDMKDFVAINQYSNKNQEMVFTKVFLSKSEYNKAIQESKKWSNQLVQMK